MIDLSITLGHQYLTAGTSTVVFTRLPHNAGEGGQNWSAVWVLSAQLVSRAVQGEHGVRTQKRPAATYSAVWKTEFPLVI